MPNEYHRKSNWRNLQKKYVLLIFSCTFCFWITTIIVRRHGYVPGISRNPAMWAIGHFAQYFVLGTVAPDYVNVSWLIGFGFEMFEYIGQLLEWPFLIGKPMDPVVNALGLYCGYNLSLIQHV